MPLWTQTHEKAARGDETKSEYLHRGESRFVKCRAELVLRGFFAVQGPCEGRRSEEKLPACTKNNKICSTAGKGHKGQRPALSPKQRKQQKMAFLLKIGLMATWPFWPYGRATP